METEIAHVHIWEKTMELLCTFATVHRVKFVRTIVYAPLRDLVDEQ